MSPFTDSDSDNVVTPSYSVPLPSRDSVQVAVAESETFYGIPHTNPRKDRFVRIVLRLALLAVVIEAYNFSTRLLANGNKNLAQSMLNLFVALSIPYCGYVGAKRNDRSMVWWFCSCNFLEAFWGTVYIAVLLLHTKAVVDVCNECAYKTDFEPADNSNGGDEGKEGDGTQTGVGVYGDDDTLHGGQGSPYSTYSDDEDVNRRHELYLQCLMDNKFSSEEQCFPENIRKEDHTASISMITLIPLVLINFITGWYGNLLYREDGKVEVHPSNNSGANNDGFYQSTTPQAAVSVVLSPTNFQQQWQPTIVTPQSLYPPSNPYAFQLAAASLPPSSEAAGSAGGAAPLYHQTDTTYANGTYAELSTDYASSVPVPFGSVVPTAYLLERGAVLHEIRSTAVGREIRERMER